MSDASSRICPEMLARGKRWRQRAADRMMADNPGKYERIVSSLGHVAASSVDKFAEVDKDIPRSFGTLPEEYRYSTAQDDMREVLLAYMLHRQDVGYCQGMSFLVAVMLGHMGKEEAFWLLVSIVEELPEDFYKNTALTECEILQGLVAERLPALREHLGPQFPLAVNFLAVRWFITFFVHETPLETTRAVWDVFFKDGLIAIYRASLALMEVHSGPLLARYDELTHALDAARAGRGEELNARQIEAMSRQHESLSHMSFVKELSRLTETDSNVHRLLARMSELGSVVTETTVDERRNARRRGASTRQRSLGARIAAALEDEGTACTMKQLEHIRFLCAELVETTPADGARPGTVASASARNAFAQAFPDWPSAGADQLFQAFPRCAYLAETSGDESDVWHALAAPEGLVDVRALVAGLAFFLNAGVEEKLRACYTTYIEAGAPSMPVATATRMLNALRALAALWFDAYGVYERGEDNARVASGALIDPRLIQDAERGGEVGDADPRDAPPVHTPPPYMPSDVAREESPDAADFGAVRRCVLADSVLVLCLRHRKPRRPEPIVRVASSEEEPAVDILRFFMEPIQLFAPGSRGSRSSRRNGGDGGGNASSSSSQGLEPTDRRKRRSGGDDDDGDGMLGLISCGTRRGSKHGEADKDDGCNVQ